MGITKGFFGGNSTDIILTRMDNGFSAVSEEQLQLSEILMGVRAYLSEVNDYVRRLESQVQDLRSTVSDIAEQTSDTLAMVSENKQVRYIGKETEILETAEHKVQEYSPMQRRKAIDRAVRALSKGIGAQKARTLFYDKLHAVTGIHVYDFDKIKFTKDSDYAEFAKLGESYVNVIFSKGIDIKATILAEDIIKGAQ